MGLISWVRNWLGKSNTPAAPESVPEAPKASGSGIRSWLRKWLGGKESPAGAPPTETAVAVAEEPQGEPETVYDLWHQETPPEGEPAWTPFTPEQKAALTAQWVKLRSTNVDQIRYFADTKILEVLFLQHGPNAPEYRYNYYDVPYQVFLDFCAAESPGRFVWNTIRANGYRYARIGEGFEQLTDVPEFVSESIGQRALQNEVRALLPEEIEQHQSVLDWLKPGEFAKVNEAKVKEHRYRNFKPGKK